MGGLSARVAARRGCKRSGLALATIVVALCASVTHAQADGGAPSVYETEYGPWYQCWTDKDVDIQWSFGNGGAHLKRRSGKPGHMGFVPRYMPGMPGKQTLVQFKLGFWFWQMRPYWRSVRLIPRGKIVPELNATLPPWNPNDPQVLVTYRDVLAPLVGELQRKQMRPGKDFYRLESLFPVGAGGELAVDVVRALYLENAVDLGDGKKQNLALIVFGYLEGTGVGTQNGGGSGPPN